MVQMIEAKSVDALFGSKAGLDKAIVSFQKALEKHAKTEGKPAPSAHPFVEIIVREHHGQYEMVKLAEPVMDDVAKNFVRIPDTPAEDTPMTLDDMKSDMIYRLNDVRYNRQMDGVTYKGNSYNGDPLTVNALMAAYLASEDTPNILVRWKDNRGGYSELERTDMLVLIKLIRKLTQTCFDNEYRLTMLIKTAPDEQQLKRVNITTGWPE